MALEILEEKEIDSIIDKAKAFGLYSLESINIKDSDSCQHIDDFFSDVNSTEFFFDSTPEESINNLCENWRNELLCDVNVRSDSEVTIIRIRKERLQLNKLTCNNWAEIHDEAVPGDGTHLGESPSLVNLVTFITNTSNIKKEAGEYMIPISTWNPILQKSENNISNKTQSHSKKLLSSKSESMQIEEIHRSLNISRISNSHLHIPYMMKRKISPRPGALFSQNVKLSKELEIENSNIISIYDNKDQDKKEFDVIKPPPVHNNPRTLKGRLRRLMKVTICACCRMSKSKNTTNNKNTNFQDRAVQTIINLENYL